MQVANANREPHVFVIFLLQRWPVRPIGAVRNLFAFFEFVLFLFARVQFSEGFFLRLEDLHPGGFG